MKRLMIIAAMLMTMTGYSQWVTNVYNVTGSVNNKHGLINSGIVVVDTNYTIKSTDYMIIDSTLTGSDTDTLTLPINPYDGEEHIIYVTNAGGNNTRIYGNGKQIFCNGFTEYANINGACYALGFYTGRLKYSSLAGYWIIIY